MKQKQLFIICMLLMGVYFPAAYSQVILDKEHNLPRSGDKLCKVSLTVIDYSGKEMDLRGRIIDDTPILVEYFSELGSDDRYFSKIDEGTIWHYESSNSKVRLLGYESQMVKVNFSIPLEIIHFPFNPNDSILSHFEGFSIDQTAIFGARFGE